MLIEKNPKKIKILTISDHPLVTSGVGTQTRYIIEGLLKTGNYQVLSLGAAIKHNDYRPQKIQDYGDDWVVLPIDGYGNETIIREILDVEKPDAIWFMTDPRFYTWLFAMSDEIRDRGVPLLYYHIWDNYPVPKYNKSYYESCDFLGCISSLTYDVVSALGFSDRSEYIPHSCDENIFKPLPEDEIVKHKIAIVGEDRKDDFVVFYNSRNARRKMTSDVVKCFKMFKDQIKNKDAFLLMHTDPFDPEGANLFAVCEMLGMSPKDIVFSNARLPPEQMNIFYNVADVTINISNNEGWGLSSTESLFAGTPVISNRTGGLQDQNYNKETEEEYGVSIVPATRSLTGSQQIPYILDDRCADEDVVDALMKIYNMKRSERRALGLKGREFGLKNFNLANMIGKWDNAITKYVTEFKKNGYRNRVRVAKV